MPYRTYTQDEIARAAGVSLHDVEQFEHHALLRPAAVTDEKNPIYDEENLQELRTLRGLMALGYGLADITKIARKVGVPSVAQRSGRRTGRLLTVGELAQRAQLNPRTIKYWEEQEILTPEAYSEGGFRLYTEDYVLFCHLIRDLQLFGYSLKEIKETADLFRAFYALSMDPATAVPREAIAAYGEMLTRIEELRGRMRVLHEGIRRWEGFADKYAKRIIKLKGQTERRLRTAAPVGVATHGDPTLPEPAGGTT